MSTMLGQDVGAVDEFGKLMEEMLEKAQEIEQRDAVATPLNRSDLAESFERIPSVFSASSSTEYKKHAVEAAVRPIFYNLLATTPFDSPSFVKVWNLLDIVAILCDDEHADPALFVWLVEELLDSQTTSACRKIFDYLELRRERMIAKQFGAKKLVILRTCNELLRRLSRAEDTAFCGRVFIFLFQSFPLGDKSAVNLRGEFHTTNVTTFEQLSAKEVSPVNMEVEVETKPGTDAKVANGSKVSGESTTGSKGVSFSKTEKILSTDELYPIFWGLQQTFSEPRSLFEAENFASFKSGLAATMAKFKSVQAEHSGRPSKVAEESKKGTKRKRGQGDDDLANAFNPKYLTSPDLFELEINDLSFRRHVLVQVLIIMEFILSQSARAKAKIAKAYPNKDPLPNKGVTYAWDPSEEDIKWALDTKGAVAEYLKQGYEGPFYHRMIETVLARDKNWARWKIDSCPSISRDAISADDYAEAKVLAGKAFKRLKFSSPIQGAVELNFLDEGKHIDRLKDRKRYELKPVGEYKDPIAMDDLDMSWEEGEGKQKFIEAKASKSWRALRTVTTTKLVTFDQIGPLDKIDAIFEDNPKPEALINESEAMEIDTPTDRKPVIISGPSGVGKGTLVAMLMQRHPNVFGKKASHTTRAPRAGEVHGQHYFFVNKLDYDVLRDGDRFLEYNEFNGNHYGTDRKVVDAIKAQDKIPLMEMDYHGIQQLKDQQYPSRFIFLAPPDVAALKDRLTKRGTDDEEKIKQRLEIALEEMEHSKIEGFHDKIIVSDDLETTYQKLEDFIFGREEKSEGETVEEENVEAVEEKVEAVEEKVEAVEEKVEAVENGHTTPVVAETVAEAGSMAE